MRRVIASLVIGVGLACASGGVPSAEPLPGPQEPAPSADGGQLWLIPSSEPGVLMHATVFRPQHAGTFPLVVINHGSDQNEIRRVGYATPTYETASRWFVQRGYAVVVPQRPGHGETGGRYLEDQGGCDDANYVGSGLATASSIQAAIDYMTAQPFVRREGVVAVGQSAGGWGTLALASRNPRGVAAAINFAGGRGGRIGGKPNSNCAPDRLVEAAARFGSTARIPTLWLYAENDTYFAPTLSQSMAQAFRAAGGRVEFHLLPALKDDGHVLIESQEGVTAWEPIAAAFLAKAR